MENSLKRLGSFFGVFRQGPDSDIAAQFGGALPQGLHFHESQTSILACDAWEAIQHNRNDRLIGCGLTGFVLNGPATDADQSPVAWLASTVLENGPGALRGIDGPFLMAMSPLSSQAGTVIRDKFGAKQLYYTVSEGLLWFGDHYLPLLRVLPKTKVRTNALLEWLHFGAPLPPATFFEEICTLPPGHLLHFEPESERLDVVRYFDVAGEASAETYRALGEQDVVSLERELDRHLQNAVRIATRGRSRVTVLLSGGVDSSVLTAIAAKQTEVDAVTIDVCGEDALSERPYAEAAALHIGVPLIVSRFGAASFRETIVDTVYQLGTPTIVENAVALLHAAMSGSLPRSQLILDGEGADALFGGSTELYKFSMLCYLATRLAHVSDRQVERASSAIRRKLGKLGLSTLSMADQRGLDWILGVRGAERVLRRQHLASVLSHLPTSYARETATLMLEDFDGHLSPIILRLDPCSQLAASGIVLPFLETQMFAFSLNVPIEHKFHWAWRRLRPEPKWLLKKVATRYVPKSVVWRPKGGFDVPGGRWIGSLPEKWLLDSWVASQFGISSETLRKWLTSIGTHRDRMFLATMEIWGRLFAMRTRLDIVKDEWDSASA